MSTAQSISPKGELQHLFPSPTYSDSTSSSTSHLYTPVNGMANHAQDANDRLSLHRASISAANAAFVSTTKRNDTSMSGDTTHDDSSLIFAHNVSGVFDADMSGDTQSLAAAIDFDRMNADMQQALGSGDSYSFLGKRPTTSQPFGSFGSMLHVRADSNWGRRHSIQPLMPSSDSSSSLADYASLAGNNAGARSMSISVDAFGSFGYHANVPHSSANFAHANAQDMSETGFLMSPPRLTVSMSNSNSSAPTPLGDFAEDAKRRRTSEVDATPERSVEQLAQQQRFLPQQTPPNMYAYQLHLQFSIGSSVGGGLETPSSVQSSASPCRIRRLSLTAMDHAAHIANLTANLSLPSFGGEQSPKSAPPRAASDAMQRAQSQSSLSRKATEFKSGTNGANGNASGNATPNSNSKNQDVWPDDVEVVFWEGKFLFLLALVPQFPALFDFPSPQPSFGFKTEQSQAGLEGNLQPPTLLRKRGLSMNKPNLMVSIPPAPAYLNPQRSASEAMLSPHPQLSPAASPTPAAWVRIQQRAVHTPITQFPQVGAGPYEPPPLNTGDDARMQKERLERHWASQGNPLGGALPSPLDMSFNQSEVNNVSMGSAGMAVAAAANGNSDSALDLMVPGGMHSGLPLMSPAGFDIGSKMGGDSSMDSGNNSFEQMLNEGDLSNDATTQEYLSGLLTSIGVEGQEFTATA
ncbi:hypothetical protein NDA13_003758 [Ustilago tritici]|nr:hypothetical protein NDA13_003758 [Ustilago tritici]